MKRRITCQSTQADFYEAFSFTNSFSGAKCNQNRKICKVTFLPHSLCKLVFSTDLQFAYPLNMIETPFLNEMAMLASTSTCMLNSRKMNDLPSNFDIFYILKNPCISYLMIDCNVLLQEDNLPTTHRQQTAHMHLQVRLAQTESNTTTRWGRPQHTVTSLASTTGVR